MITVLIFSSPQRRVLCIGMECSYTLMQIIGTVVEEGEQRCTQHVRVDFHQCPKSNILAFMCLEIHIL